MKTALKAKLPKARKSVSVRFRTGAGSHQKGLKTERHRVAVALKRGKEVFQRAI